MAPPGGRPVYGPLGTPLTPRQGRFPLNYNRKRHGLAAAGLVATLLLSATAALAEDKVMATVNGLPITEADLALAEVEIGGDLGNIPPETKKRVLVEYLIETNLFAAAAETDQLASGPDFDKRLAYWRKRALRDSYFEKAVRGGVGEASAKELYDNQVKVLPPEEEVQARHILVESEDKAKDIVAKLASGGDFAALAKENSSDPGSKDDGGMLGYFSKGQMVPSFEEAAFTLKKGEVSKPVQSQFGWHIIKLEDRRQKPPPAFADVKDRIIGSMIQSKAQSVAGDLRSKAKIEYVDEGIKKEVAAEAEKAKAQQEALEAQIKAATEKAAKKDDGGAPKPDAK
jgi:peptidyl-prolyl cis-trans isomerase C